MTAPAFWTEGWTAALLNHLWQSTIAAGLAWLLALALRRNQARTRYWVWMAASLKFLVPFSVLIALGERVRPLIQVPAARPQLATAMEQISQSLPKVQFFTAGGAPPTAHSASLLPAALLAIWACGALVVVCRFARAWWKVYAAKCAAVSVDLAIHVPVLCSPGLIEPGIFGVLRPVLLLPEGILQRLTPEQLDAIVAHEMCHARRRDNLTFAVHMIAEILFWFYPLVWWIGAKLLEERELACDEAVLQSGSEAQTYAEGILSVCRFYVESPLACVSGVTGSDLKKRIVRIMAEHAARNLGWRRRLLLAGAGALAVIAPVGMGLVHAGQSATPGETRSDVAANLPQFEVASIKPSKSANGMIQMQMTADGITVTGLPLHMLVREAFGVSNDRLLGEPGWVNSARYDIDAKVAPEDAPKLKQLTNQERWAMLLPLLEERCGLKFHHETKSLEVYALVVAKGGSKLKEAAPGDAYAGGLKGPNGPGGGGAMRMSPGWLTAQGVPMERLVRMLSLQLGSTVVDKTGLTGRYDVQLQWTPEEGMGSAMGPPPSGPLPPAGAPPPPVANGPSLFTALEEQLGLKLQAQKEPVDVIVIDHIEQPSAN